MRVENYFLMLCNNLTKGTGLKILTSKEMFQRSPIVRAQQVTVQKIY